MTAIVVRPTSSPHPSSVAGQLTSGAASEHVRQLAEQTAQRLLEASVAGPERRRELLDEVVTSHLWLADRLAHRYQYRGEDEQDLLQVARAGLVEASRRYDPDRGAFVSFAVPTILGVVKRHFRDQGWGIRPPRRTQEIAFQIRRGWPALVQSLGAIPTEADLAADLDASVADIREAQYASQGYSCTLLDATTEPGFDHGQVRAEGDQVEARIMLSRVWDQLDSTEQDLLRLRFYSELSQHEIATLLGTSQMQVSRCLTRLLNKLRTLIGGDDAIAS